MRIIENVMEEWLFKKTEEIPNVLPADESWDRISLPHTYNAFDGQDGGNDYYKGKAVYVLTESLYRNIEADIQGSELILQDFLKIKSRLFLLWKQIIPTVRMYILRWLILHSMAVFTEM